MRVGDTQVHVKTSTGGQVFSNNMQWVAGSYVYRNVRFVTPLGDIVQDGGYGSPTPRTWSMRSGRTSPR